MSTFNPDLMDHQEYMATQFNMDDLAYQLNNPSNLKTDMLGNFMHPFEDLEFPEDRSLSFSGSSSQSISPQPHHRQMMSQQLPELQGTSPLFNAARFEPISPVSSEQSIPSGRKDSFDDDHRTERRRAQNRAAQRAYRQRKDQSLKQREQEVQSLKDELEKAQKLNKTLCKVVAVLRERLKEPAEEEEQS
ncbi:uncharacterized protein AB675_6386 [Cyphellophora attinorum]|uniref:Putative transcription factor kapC n=1 Tax=Cyphellophora attinorum TaxID=1664694 RepID=A0A0N1H9A0_9EURO|nr:uncharacterized protein AB675_6386 [Phialophora attinorum]KPI44050.1 hypothetical protein AB675_6386 [Phialophora attinorum]